MTWHEGWITLAAFVAVAIAFIGIILSNRRTKESIELVKRELDVNLRPWIRITSPYGHRAIFEGEKLVPYAEMNNFSNTSGLKPKSIRIQIQIVNEGKTPAYDVKNWNFQSEEEFDRKSLREKGNRIRGIPLHPGEKYDQNFDIPYEIYQKFAEKNYFFGIDVEYGIDEKTRKFIGKIWRIESNVFHIETSWFDD